MVCHMFVHIEAERILIIPFFIHQEDILAWKHEKTSMYSIKSGYIEAIKMSNRAYCMELDRKWSWVWSMEVMPKVCLFMWRVCIESFIRVLI